MSPFNILAFIFLFQGFSSDSVRVSRNYSPLSCGIAIPKIVYCVQSLTYNWLVNSSHAASCKFQIPMIPNFCSSRPTQVKSEITPKRFFVPFIATFSCLVSDMRNLALIFQFRKFLSLSDSSFLEF